MPLWGRSDTSSSTPKNKILDDFKGRGSNLYANTSPGQIVHDQVVGVYSVSATDIAVGGLDPLTLDVVFGPVGLGSRITTNTVPSLATSAGWILEKFGTGPVSTIVIKTGGSLYSNTDTVVVYGGTVNASATVSTNSTGGILNVVLTNPGSGFSNVSSASVRVANSTLGNSAGSNATFSVGLGGRAGRRNYETLVAIKINK